jgi:hypothetical protein
MKCDVHGAVCFRSGQVLVLKQMNPLVYSSLQLDPPSAFLILSHSGQTLEVEEVR